MGSFWKETQFIEILFDIRYMKEEKLFAVVVEDEFLLWMSYEEEPETGSWLHTFYGNLDKVERY